MRILAIDPGNEKSAYVLMDIDGDGLRLLEFGKDDNGKVIARVKEIDDAARVIEMVASYGMAVGREVFDTCVWIGRFYEAMGGADFVYRKEEKITLCGSMKARDANIRQALIDRYARHDLKTGKGTKKNPDTFYGVAADVWQAVAVGVTYYERGGFID